jgi:hypothetical protein
VRHGICTETHGKLEREPLSSIQMQGGSLHHPSL